MSKNLLPISPNSNKGYTLLEMLIASLIVVILIGSVTMVFLMANKSWNEAEAKMQVYQNTKEAFSRMSREIQSALINSANTIYCIGYDGSSGLRADEGIDSSIADEFYFVAPINPGQSDKSDLCEVGYWLDGNSTLSKADDVLRRFYVTDDRKVDPLSPEFDYTWSPTPSNIFGTPAGKSNGPDELALNIIDLQFLYWDDKNTVDWATAETSWDSRTSNNMTANPDDDGNLPSAVKIIIEAQDKKGRYNQKFESIVYIQTY